MSKTDALRQALSETMERGDVMVSLRCFKCGTVKVVDWNDAVAPSHDKPMELRAKGTWYLATRVAEATIEEAADREVEEAKQNAVRLGQDPDECNPEIEIDPQAGPWRTAYGKPLCTLCSRKFKRIERDMGLKALEEL